MYKLGNASNRNLEGVNAKLYQVLDRALQISVVDFGVPSTGGKRTGMQQHELYTQGLSKLDGYKKISRHQSGNAVDIFAYVDGKASYDELDLAMCAAAILQAASELGISIRWGGLWRSFKDMPHFEIA